MKNEKFDDLLLDPFQTYNCSWIKQRNKAGYTATQVACGWAGAIFEVTRPFGQEQWGPKIKFIKKVKK